MLGRRGVLLMALMLAFVLVFALGVQSAFADVSGPWTYYDDGTGHAVIQIYDAGAPGGAVAIPDQLGGMDVVKLEYDYSTGGLGVFQDRTDITSVTMPNTITDLDHDNFYGCTGLTSVTLSTALTDTGYNTFYGCTSLATIALPAGLTSVSGSAFQGCNALATVTIPAGVTVVADFAFNGCPLNQASMKLPAGLTTIGN